MVVAMVDGVVVIYVGVVVDVMTMSARVVDEVVVVVGVVIVMAVVVVVVGAGEWVVVPAGVVVGVAGEVSIAAGVIVGRPADRLGEVLGLVAEPPQLSDGVPGLGQAARRRVGEPGAGAVGPVVHHVHGHGRSRRRGTRRQRQQREQGQRSQGRSARHGCSPSGR